MTPIDDLHDYMALPRLSGLRLSPDGSWLAASVSAALWRRLFGTPQSHPERYSANSPRRHAARITTPMLIVHGDRDDGVPIGEALRMWAGLAGGPSGQAGAKFRYFPDENHWVPTLGNATIWYETVFAFLGQPWRRLALL